MGFTSNVGEFVFTDCNKIASRQFPLGHAKALKSDAHSGDATSSFE
jgi:hypothetical protein